MVTDGTGSGDQGEQVNQLLSQYVHKLNNAMLPFVLELDDLLGKMNEHSRLDQLKLQRFDTECRAQLEIIQRIRSLISCRSESDFE
ncbi:MAG: hypothetical protein CMN90_03920 [Sutterellaceae bacterium]|nr:hypothetical protein [Sutterellaceae bacterium]|tara:strand:+ start:4020 stop:4277 length:258 start_codon:yes stop_codon:yes gene_type:complete